MDNSVACIPKQVKAWPLTQSTTHVYNNCTIFSCLLDHASRAPPARKKHVSISTV